MFTNMKAALLALVCSSVIVSAVPGYGPSSSKYGPSTTCTMEYITTTSCGTSTTGVTESKTIWVPVTSTCEVPSTTIIPVPQTYVTSSSKTVTSYKTEVTTKTIPVTTWSTDYVTNTVPYTTCEVVPYTTVETGYSTIVTEVPSKTVYSSASISVCTITKYVPFTTTAVSTKTECKTLGGYGNH